jgi:hypothetical protein
MPGVCASYRLEWRYRLVERDGRVREVTRARLAHDGASLKSLAADAANEAVGREFMVGLMGVAEDAQRVCVRAEELAVWTPTSERLPCGTLHTYWEDDERSGAQRYRLLSTIAAAFSEARSLRLVGRHESREIMRSVRRAFLRE